MEHTEAASKRSKFEILSADSLDRISFQLSLLYRAGVPSEESLYLLAEDMAGTPLGAVLQTMADEMGKGCSLSEAASVTGAFPVHFQSMLEIGEVSGNTDEVLSSLSTYYRREANTQATLRRALTYPAMMAGLVVVVFAVMLSQVLPVFSQVFEQMGVTLPPLAQTLLSFGNGSSYVAGALCVVLLVSTVWFLIRAKQGKGFPFGRKATESIDRGQFASALSLLLASGMSLENSLEYVQKLLPGSRLAPKLAVSRQRMEEGTSFSKALEETEVLSALQSGLLSAGMRSGDTERAMDEVASRCLTEGEEAISNFVTRLEFLLVVILCGAVGLVLLSVMLPLVGILSAIG